MNRDSIFGALCIVFCVVLLVGCSIAISAYRASVQVNVYRRQGVEMSTWEVMMGAKPAERTVTIK